MRKFPREIKSQQIGELILAQLSQISQVAYIRFASVYGNFTSIDDFVTILQKLENKPELIGVNGQNHDNAEAKTEQVFEDD